MSVLFLPSRGVHPPLACARRNEKISGYHATAFIRAEPVNMEHLKISLSRILSSLPRRLGWTRASYYLMSGFLLAIALIIYVWWPLVVEYWASYNPAYPFWQQFDWLLLGIFGFMSFQIMRSANIKTDLPMIAIGLVGGLVIESWGTQTELWTYYTFERPPLWIIPAWPIASLSIDRLYRTMIKHAEKLPDRLFKALHWILLPLFYLQMFIFTAPTLDKSLTIMALILVAFLILTPPDDRKTVLVFLAGSGLGYFLERWGTTRLAWTYHTLETPPLFAVLAHGMAAVAFWRVFVLYMLFKPRLSRFFTRRSILGDESSPHRF